MERMDRDMPFLLQYEHVAWFEKGKVRILDRRVYPTEVRFVVCTDYHEVVQAIADMVTQSAGPYTAVGMGIAGAALATGIGYCIPSVVGLVYFSINRKGVHFFCPCPSGSPCSTASQTARRRW